MSDKEKKIRTVQAGPMKHFCVNAFKQVGLSQEHAELLADTLVQADLRGVHSHGVMRVPWYVRGYQTGGLNPQPSIKVIKESGATAVMDGDNGLGLITSYPAMKLAIDKAAEYGVGTVTVRKSGHCGMLAYWSMMALECDMIGYATTNTSPIMAPWFGLTPSYGNNPISYAIPAGRELPLVLDMAVSVVAQGKIRLAHIKNEPIPLGWAMDKNGEPTTDTQAALDGFLMPIGGYKGYGMALVNDVLCGVLSGGIFGKDLARAPVGSALAGGYCHFLMALDIAHFTPVSEFKERVDKMVRMMKSSQLAKGQKRVYLPGEIEFENHRQRIKEGIPYPEEVTRSLEEVAKDLCVPVSF